MWLFPLLHNKICFRETEEKTFSGQRDTCRRITERLNDITFWRNELATELERMLTETHQLQDVRRAVEKANQDCDPPLQMAQECLYHREGRQGTLHHCVGSEWSI